ncbi:MAG: release factor glutamine methyltransferase [Thermosipho sp. (in: thermotogales)]|nr:release factor glutamine methyltransferase [Thermosipho sp. (in: thermotogales)]MDN5324596.1 release factor glutamine methyltransferase [Thermosipho sp. (in: thermotogales)]
MKIKDALELARKNGLPDLEAHIIIRFISGKSKEFIISHPNFEIDDEKFLKLIEKRKNGYPIQYIVKGKEFYKNWFYVDEGVLIPRQETELLVEKAIEFIEKYNVKKIAEIGVGSGAIIISILIETKTIGFGTDISDKAIEITKINAKRFKVEDRLFIKKGPFLEPFVENYNDIELIISNPPYVREDAILPREVLWEPKEALYAGKDGLEFYRKFLNMYDLSGKIVLMEIGHDQGDFFRKLGWNVIKDYSNNDRIAIFIDRR